MKTFKEFLQETKLSIAVPAAIRHATRSLRGETAKQRAKDEIDKTIQAHIIDKDSKVGTKHWRNFDRLDNLANKKLDARFAKESVNESLEIKPFYHRMDAGELIQHLSEHPATAKHMNPAASYDDEHTKGAGVPHKAFAKALGIHTSEVEHAVDHINSNTDNYEGHVYNDGHHVTMTGAS